MKQRFTRQLASCILAIGAVAMLCISACAAEPQSTRELSPSPDKPVIGVAARGNSAETYHYRQYGDGIGGPPHATITPSTGWYGYGFPAQSHRWGWFGAERYYPRVVWHRGYYGDCCRWSYRSGY